MSSELQNNVDFKRKYAFVAQFQIFLNELIEVYLVALVLIWLHVVTSFPPGFTSKAAVIP